MFDRVVLARIVPFAIYMGFILLADVLGRLGWSAAELRWLYPVKIAAVLAALACYWRSYTELHVAPLRPAAALLAVSAGLVVLWLWLSLNSPWMTIGDAAGYDPRDGGVIDWRLVTFRLAGAALVVPVMEELFWRSFLLRWLVQGDFTKLNPSQVKFRAFVVAMILFGIEHNLWLAGMVAGAAYSFLYMRSRTLWSPILAHGVTNGALGVWIVYSGQWTYW